MSLSQVFIEVYNRIAHALSTASRGALSFTGLLGLALLVYGYVKLRGNDNRGDERRRLQQQLRQRAAAAPTQSAPSGANAQQPSSTAAATATTAPAPSASSTPAGRAVAAQLNGVKRVTLSLPGVVFSETSPAQLQDSATVRPEALEIIQEMSRLADVYLLAHVEDDVGEAVVTGALEAAGVLGGGPGQVRPHHVLCCSTLDGKVPIVRQLEPDLHVDGHPASVDELKRFMPRLVLVREGLSGAGSSGNVGTAATLEAFFGL